MGEFMNLMEAKQILKANGCRLLKEYNGAMNIIIRTVNKILTNNNINGTVEETEIDAGINPLGTLAVTLEGAEKPYIIGYAENATGGYVVFNYIDKGNTKICSPVGDVCYSRAETYNRIIDEVTKYIQKFVLGTV